ncbi:MAG: hypothetical protein EP334_01160 [Gammaproteobacteria bacterium]|nr:MAG: hypothetical protein EP334_01160 [Gammaproteobacteria bacterium]
MGKLIHLGTIASTLLTTLLLSACTSAPPLPAGPLSDCRQLFLDLDREVAEAGVRDWGPRPIAGFPFLRVNRFLASFRHEPMDGPQIAAWVGEMAALDAAARQLELANLSRSRVTPPSPGLGAQLGQCRNLLVANLLQQPPHIQLLRQRTSVSDDYSRAWRIAGLYPLASLFVARGIERWHRDTQQTFGMPLTELPVRGQLRRWGHPASGPASSPLPGAEQNALGIPQLTEQQVRALFQRHAPIWEIDVVDDNDLVGTAHWRGGPVIDTDLASQYQLLSYTRFDDQVLVQLNYVIWFKARPGDDIYAGDIDGLTWRVTLGADGVPWLYDSVHNCGCYHQFFPTAMLQPRDDRHWPEPPLLPQRAPSEPLVVRLESGRHFIQRLYTYRGGATPRPLRLESYNRLRSLPTIDGHHSLFGRQGLVAGSERRERFLLWPMGIRSPGAMRQWGRHAVAFLGRRHFDDPRLIETLFRRAPQRPPATEDNSR